MSDIDFRPFAKKDIPLFLEWAKREHVKNSWFRDGYEPPEQIKQKVEGNGYSYPFLIVIDDKPIGYIQYCDLYAYKTLCPDVKGVFTDEQKGTVCVDIFIAEEDMLGKGWGTKIMKKFVAKLFNDPAINRICIDPNSRDTRAIRCYEKVGFHPIRKQHDGVDEALIMEILR